MADLLERERDTLLAEWRQKVRLLPSAAHLTEPTLNDHVPKLLDDLVAALRRPHAELPDFLKLQQQQDATAFEHGEQRVEDGYDIGEVAAEYGMLRSCIHTLAMIHGIPLRDGQVNALNGLLDRAICVAVHAFAVNCELSEWQRRREHLAMVAHDLRTPLHAVVLATRMLEQNELDEQEHQRMIDVLKRNVRQLSALVDAVLRDNEGSDLPGGFEQLRPRPLPLRFLVQELIDDLQSTASVSDTRLVNDVPGDLTVYADAPMLRRVFQNLISNASARNSCGPVRIGARTLDGKGGVSCWVSDEGACVPDRPMPSPQARESGSPAAARAAVSEERKSMMNLSIVKSFVKAHGGSLEFDFQGADRTGRTVRFRLPFRENAALSSDQPADGSEGGSRPAF